MEAHIAAARNFNYNPRNHNYAPSYISGFGISPAPPPLPPLSTKILARTVKAATRGPHEQAQSPLFSVLFPELRNTIFLLALTEYEVRDAARPWSKHSRYYRPDRTARRALSTSLLLTCRRIYLETHLAPAALNEHVFWADRLRGKAASGRFESSYAQYFAKMPVSQRRAVERVRIYTETNWLEGRKVLDASPDQEYWGVQETWPLGLVIPQLNITIRHTDWRFWERKRVLTLAGPGEDEGKWGMWIGNVPGLQELIFEFESTEAKKEELELLVRAACGWKFALADGRGFLKHNGRKPIESVWLASAALEPPGARRTVLDQRERDAAEEIQLDEKHPLTLKLLVVQAVFTVVVE
ncbi:hypothetical protein MKEN_00594500 [Mycena kentingensis (nom. inval.)]|nr:hypothetical protein MKEN_00594500 [Mycena kentingensis (nom. inval.)]